MPELMEQMYCSQQIVIPPKYPYVLKRYCKAAIKTQPYDLLRWSFEYFKALAEHRPPPVKLRLEYPIYSTEGGLTRGCLKVLAHQLCGMTEVPVVVLKQTWQGFCLDINELKRILCLCEVHLREESVPFRHFMAVAAGLLTKCLTHTMILICESLTKEPDGGSAAIPVVEFMAMYKFLAELDAAKDVKYYNGFREGVSPPEEEVEEEATVEATDAGADVRVGRILNMDSDEEDDFLGDKTVQKLALMDDHVTHTARISMKLNLPVLGKIERSPSIERAREIERDNYNRERKGRAAPSDETEKKLKEIVDSSGKVTAEQSKEEKSREAEEVVEKKVIDIFVFDEDDKPVTYELYGEPKEGDQDEELPGGVSATTQAKDADADEEEKKKKSEVDERTELFLAEISQIRQDRIKDMHQTFDDIAAIVDKFRTANYDLGMVAGRQMSTTSGEFIVHTIEKDILAYIDEQIAILPDPDLKKKKAKPEEVAMIRHFLEDFLDQNMDIIVPEVEEVEEEEAPIPEVTTVYAVPGIGGPVDEDIICDFLEYAEEVSKTQAELFMPRNIRHFLCPPLEKYVEINYDMDLGKKEEVATGGVTVGADAMKTGTT
ncbi:unnamed protein product [Chrysodeixis includens]|uniref:Ropporin-1-like protein n=1 Tax=Chrysodeixis includens TaxID=689277 RepID=A0A9P0BZD5_CHRIL|nr:unnamed protein product [Chrysodeixis includens]